MAMLAYIFTVFLFFPNINCRDSSLNRIRLPSPGPESFAFDYFGKGPYTTVADGRILKYTGHKKGFVEYAYTSPNRTRAICDGTNHTATLGPICGRPLGLGFYYRTGELFVVDGFYGLLVVKPKGGGLAKQLATGADGIKFGAADGLDVDQLTGNVYFTDSTAKYNMNEFKKVVETHDSTGRLLKYDRRTKKVTVLLSGLAVASGVAVSIDSSYALVTEYLNTRILKYWLKGPKANTVEVLLKVTGGPNKIRRTITGDFWVAVTIQTPSLKLTGQRIDGSGNILETVTFSPRFDSSLITEVNEYEGILYVGSLYCGYVGVYKP
jgi:sugar lactone lactonase YvrE